MLTLARCLYLKSSSIFGSPEARSKETARSYVTKKLGSAVTWQKIQQTIKKKKKTGLGKKLPQQANLSLISEQRKQWHQQFIPA